jgi:hypothetical protein
MSNTIVNPAMEIKFVRLYFSEEILREENKGYFYLSSRAVSFLKREAVSWSQIPGFM